MSTCKYAVILVFILLTSGTAFALDFNPRAVQSITMKTVQNGQLIISGSVDSANITLYVPQEGIQSLDVESSHPMKWQYAKDRMGNTLVSIEWRKPTGTVTYTITAVVKNDAKILNVLPDIGNDPKYLAETKSIVINDDIRKIAYPYEKSWDNVAHLTSIVYNMIDYDISTLGKRYSSVWTLENKRGVCVEHTNLLTALLRASGIPTRYVVGYAYSNLDKRLIGHTWIEILAGDGSWIPFDPTWMQGVYVDATHIKTANLIDDNQADTLSYTGSGKITWQRGDSFLDSLYSDVIDVIDYKLNNITNTVLIASPTGLGNYGYIKASIISNACSINQFTAISCVDKNDEDVFEIYEKNQSFFSCGPKDIYWFYREIENEGEYICPVTVFDQAGSLETMEIEVGKSMNEGKVSISGPNTVGVGESFRLTANADQSFVFYSPDFGKHDANHWDLKISRPGNYKFYLYSLQNVAVKEVNVIEEKSFDITAVAPLFVIQYSSFILNITAKNLLEEKTAKIKIEFDTKTIENTFTFKKNEEKSLQYNFTALTKGQKEIHISMTSDSLTTYTTTINVEGKNAEPGSGILDAIFGAIYSFVEFISGIF